MGVWTIVGLNLVATAVQTPGANVAIAYVDIVPAAGTLASALTSGQAYTALPLDAGLPATLAAGAALTLTDGTNVQTLTVAVPGAPAGATSIPVTSFIASAAFAAHTTAVGPTPQGSDTALYNGTNAVRVAANPGFSGAAPGESLSAGYCDGTQPTALYLLVGFFGGNTATGTPGTGTLLIADVQYWNHTSNVDTNMYQADSII